jgi:predicted permease
MNSYRQLAFAYKHDMRYTAKTTVGRPSSTLVCICVVRLLFVLFYVLFVCKRVLPPGDKLTAVNKYIISYQNSLYVGLKVHPCTGTEALYRPYGP